MSLLERLLREQMRQQLLYGRRRRPRGGSFWGPPPRGYYGWGRPRRRTNVRVGGCCLPIPLGGLTLGALGIRLANGRST